MYSIRLHCTDCSGLDNHYLKPSTIPLLRVTFFDESNNKYDTFDIKALILKSTLVDPIMDRTTIKKHNLFGKAPSQLGGKISTPTLDSTPK